MNEEDNTPYNVLDQKGYDLNELIGSGGFSECWKVYSRQYNMFFACKIISIDGLKDESLKNSYINELNALKSVIHSNIIHVYDNFSTKTHLFLILDFFSGGDLRKYILKYGPINNVIQLMDYALKILDALDYLQKNNIAHRDIKPSNILLDNYGRPKIADFGLSMFVNENDLSDSSFGSLAFIAPEVLTKKQYNPYKADVWSFGVTIFYMATGCYPFPLGNKERLKNAIISGCYYLPLNINPIIKNVIYHSLAVNPVDRMSFSELKRILETEMNKRRRSVPQCIIKQPMIIKRIRETKSMSTKSVNQERKSVKKSSTMKNFAIRRD